MNIAAIKMAVAGLGKLAAYAIPFGAFLAVGFNMGESAVKWVKDKFTGGYQKTRQKWDEKKTAMKTAMKVAAASKDPAYQSA